MGGLGDKHVKLVIGSVQMLVAYPWTVLRVVFEKELAVVDAFH